MKMINDWVPETTDLLNALVAAGFTLRSGDNGEDKFDFTGNLPEFVENLIACDESRLYVTDPSKHKRGLFLVLGNSPGELVCDYSCPGEGRGTDYLDPVVSAHYAKWSELPQPMKPDTR